MKDAAFLTFVRMLPKKPLSRAVGSATRLKGFGGAHTAAIKAFCKQYRVDVDEAELPISEYPSFASFFTRKLKPGLRPIEGGKDVPVSPVDGAVSHAGIAEKGKLIQAKGKDYSLAALLADDMAAQRFEGGPYVTIYLSPRDYHRFHAPLGGKILGYRYVPGQLWPVNRASVRGVPDLFAVNERVIIELETPLGRVAMIPVGATCVGRIRLSFDNLITNEEDQPPARVRYDLPIPIEKGEELGMFEMGSTVILVFEPGRVELADWLKEEATMRLGRAIGAPIGSK